MNLPAATPLNSTPRPNRIEALPDFVPMKRSTIERVA